MTLFGSDFQETDSRLVNFNESGVSYDMMMQLLRHMYSDHQKIDSKSIYELLALADRYDITSIKKSCEQIFSQHINVDTVCQIFKYANSFNCNRLKETCLLFTEENYDDVIHSEGFADLDKEEILQIINMMKEKKRAGAGVK